MSTPTLSCAAVRPRLADRLDDLLEPDEVERLDAHLAACAACASAFATRSRAKAAIESAWTIEAPAGDLAERARTSFALLGRAPSRARRLVLVATHAAALAAGVLLALAVNHPGGSGAATPVGPSPSSAEPSSRAPAFLFAPRRIR